MADYANRRIHDGVATGGSNPAEYQRSTATKPEQKAAVLNSALDASDLQRTTTDVVALATRLGLPTMCGGQNQVAVGGLMAYGIDVVETWRVMAKLTDKVLRGANPGDLPVEQPTKFYLVVNQTTLASLGLTLPQSVKVQVTEWVQ